MFKPIEIPIQFQNEAIQKLKFDDDKEVLKLAKEKILKQN